MTDIQIKNRKHVLNQRIIENIELGSIMKTDEKRVKSVDFINTLIEMISTYNVSLLIEDNKSA
ncbi:hypothetical protein ACFQPF_03645 [Fictibacillus iocasae]|uniref:Resolvase/invertase-type recombinase catalytic domain-containing protein n=1 Tax=Fictibacillus iocasae TaxID=2715437 RepID=A0ABW2NNJ1_9BACL